MRYNRVEGQRKHNLSGTTNQQTKMKIHYATLALLAGVSVVYSSCVAPTSGYISYNSPYGVSTGVAWTNASYDSEGFPIFGYSYGRPVYGYTAAGAAIFTIAALTALCYVPHWGPASWYHGHAHYPHGIHRVAAPPRHPAGHAPSVRPPAGAHMGPGMPHHAAPKAPSQHHFNRPNAAAPKAPSQPHFNRPNAAAPRSNWNNRPSQGAGKNVFPGGNAARPRQGNPGAFQSKGHAGNSAPAFRNNGNKQGGMATLPGNTGRRVTAVPGSNGGMASRSNAGGGFRSSATGGGFRARHGGGGHGFGKR